MNTQANFRGQSGQVWSFSQIDKNAGWASSAGVAVFAAPEAFGWRIIRIVELTGRDHATQPIWALLDAERYGATAVFIAPEIDREKRLVMIDDIENGLSPVCHSAKMPIAA